MNIDKIRVVGSLCNAITGEYANPRIWGHLPVANLVHPNNAVAFIGYCQHGSEYYIEGSPLSWFLGRNDCGPCALDLLDSWVDAVVAIAYPDLKFVISRITYCEVFAMINAGDRQTVDHTVEYIDAFASIKYSREDINCYPSIVGPGTLYSRDIVGLRVTNYLLRIYNKSAQQYECSPMLFALPSSDNLLRIEFAIGSQKISGYRKSVLNGRRFEMNDFKSMYYELLGKMQLCDPTHPAVDKGLSDKQKVIYNAWRNGRDVTNRDYRTLKEIRDRTGYNLFRPSSPQMMFDTKIPYLRMEQLKNPANDYEKILWEEYKRVYGNPFER